MAAEVQKLATTALPAADTTAQPSTTQTTTAPTARTGRLWNTGATATMTTATETEMDLDMETDMEMDTSMEIRTTTRETMVTTREAGTRPATTAATEAETETAMDPTTAAVTIQLGQATSHLLCVLQRGRTTVNGPGKKQVRDVETVVPPFTGRKTTLCETRTGPWDKQLLQLQW